MGVQDLLVQMRLVLDSAGVCPCLLQHGGGLDKTTDVEKGAQLNPFGCAVDKLQWKT